MQSKIPLPTDNIYKFYALLGLLILLTTAIMFFIRHEHYNSMAFDRYIPMETLKAKETLNEDENLELFLYEQKAEIAKSNKDLELGIYLTCFFVFGGGFTAYGFHHWHTKIQPKQDRLLDLQIQKSENDVKAFNKQLHRTRYTRR
ncbi:hypothetical protein [Shewanella polaris]|uniref:Uncharacterized protein n=1 Tax=Shewanella polaris TaxID=2588449 RepID=A0A4Y5YH45_9GAMM|nr:hypothetical protein [Shewanella polaris]QDE31987.1 hypothetical protein FH971_14070 [Shewanella polaris]